MLAKAICIGTALVMSHCAPAPHHSRAAAEPILGAFTGTCATLSIHYAHQPYVTVDVRVDRAGVGFLNKPPVGPSYHVSGDGTLTVDTTSLPNSDVEAVEVWMGTQHRAQAVPITCP